MTYEGKKESGGYKSDPRFLFGYKNPELAEALNKIYESVNGSVLEPEDSFEPLNGPLNFDLQGGIALAAPLIELAQKLGLRVRVVIDECVIDSSENVVTVTVSTTGDDGKAGSDSPAYGLSR